MNTITSVQNALETIGLRQTTEQTWGHAAGCGRLTVSVLDDGEPTIRATWTDGNYVDITFFKLAESGALLVWLDWYLKGNRITVKGTIGYAAQAAA